MLRYSQPYKQTNKQKTKSKLNITPNATLYGEIITCRGPMLCNARQYLAARACQRFLPLWPRKADNEVTMPSSLGVRLTGTAFERSRRPCHRPHIVTTPVIHIAHLTYITTTHGTQRPPTISLLNGRLLPIGPHNNVAHPWRPVTVTWGVHGDWDSGENRGDGDQIHGNGNGDIQYDNYCGNTDRLNLSQSKIQILSSKL